MVVLVATLIVAYTRLVAPLEQTMLEAFSKPSGIGFGELTRVPGDFIHLFFFLGQLFFPLLSRALSSQEIIERFGGNSLLLKRLFKRIGKFQLWGQPTRE